MELGGEVLPPIGKRLTELAPIAKGFGVVRLRADGLIVVLASPDRVAAEFPYASVKAERLGISWIETNRHVGVFQSSSKVTLRAARRATANEREGEVRFQPNGQVVIFTPGHIAIDPAPIGHGGKALQQNPARGESPR